LELVSPLENLLHSTADVTGLLWKLKSLEKKLKNQKKNEKVAEGDKHERTHKASCICTGSLPITWSQHGSRA
tara:strand:- start:84749 stop:84964 length:216 start_codon:yes stop_codon:yes gene_type:complete